MKNRKRILSKLHKKVVKALEKTGRQFYDEEGNKITVEEFVELVQQEDPKDLKAFLKKMNRNKQKHNKEGK